MNPEKLIRLTSQIPHKIKKHISPDNILCISSSQFNVFEEFLSEADVKIMNDMAVGLDKEQPIMGNPSKLLEMIDEKFDLIVGGFQLDDIPDQWNDPEVYFQIGDSEVWSFLYNALLLLDTSGYALCFVLDQGYRLGWKRLLDFLSEQGIYLTSMIGFDNDVFADLIEVEKAYTGLAPAIAVFSKEERENIFIAEIEIVDNIPVMIENFFDLVDGNNLVEGLFVDRESFKNISSYKINEQISRLQTQYSEYKSYPIGDLMEKLGLGIGPGLVSTIGDNSIVIIGNDVFSYDTKIKEKIEEEIEVCVIELKENFIINKYLEIFFTSEIGKRILDNTKIGDYLFTSKFGIIENIFVPVPPLAIQQKMVETYTKLSELTDKIFDFTKELSINPGNTELIQAELNDFWEKINFLTEADRILSLIRKGETKTLEFKQTLSFDVRKNKKAAYIETAVLKTIVGFLNTEGGILMVGISDEGLVTGLDNDLKLYNNSPDKLQLHLRNLIKEKIGELHYPDINYRVIDVNEKLILYIECAASDDPCFLNEKEFYIRTTPATDKLEGQKMYDYIKRRFEK